MTSTPDGLGAAGRALWDSIIGAGHKLGPADAHILLRACKAEDMIDRLEEAQRDKGLTTTGSQDQEVISSLIPEIRQYAVLIVNTLKALKLPDEPARAAQKARATSEKARQAARARWGTGGVAKGA